MPATTTTTIVPSTRPGGAPHVVTGQFACTCEGYQWRGTCTHSEAMAEIAGQILQAVADPWAEGERVRRKRRKVCAGCPHGRTALCAATCQRMR